MLDTCNVITFAATKDVEAARKFYEHTLGLQFVLDEPFALIFDANGIMLRLSKVQEHTPPRYTVLGWQIPKIDEAVEKLSLNGVKFENYDGLEQDDLGICTFPNGDRVAWFNDPDGNTLSITQFNPEI